MEFTAFGKIPRLFRRVVITEKLDGTNAAVGIEEDGTVYAQSRNRIITPEQDNFGFARWVHENAEALTDALGPGLHFGEWWGSGIQRGYGLQKGEKRFSLFNTKRWDTTEFGVPGLGVVSVLYDGMFSEEAVGSILSGLAEEGSTAAPGFDRPEGIIIYHTAGGYYTKVTLNGDGNKGMDGR